MDASSREDAIRTRLADITGPEPSGPERALLGRLIRSFLAKTPLGMDQPAELLRGGTPGEVRDHARGLKGSASNLGAGTLAAIFAEVEHAACNGRPLDRDLPLGRIGAEFARALRATTSRTVARGSSVGIGFDQER